MEIVVWLLKNWKLASVILSTAILMATIASLKYENQSLALQVSELKIESMECKNTLKNTNSIIEQYRLETEQRKIEAQKAIDESKIKSLENYKLIQKIKEKKPQSNDCVSANELLNEYMIKDKQ